MFISCCPKTSPCEPHKTRFCFGNAWPPREFLGSTGDWDQGPALRCGHEPSRDQHHRVSNSETPKIHWECGLYQRVCKISRLVATLKPIWNSACGANGILLPNAEGVIVREQRQLQMLSVSRFKNVCSTIFWVTTPTKTTRTLDLEWFGWVWSFAQNNSN